jgi:hypothetical protein
MASASRLLNAYAHDYSILSKYQLLQLIPLFVPNPWRTGVVIVDAGTSQQSARHHPQRG